jgi:hypothetical protein
MGVRVGVRYSCCVESPRKRRAVLVLSWSFPERVISRGRKEEKGGICQY